MTPAARLQAAIELLDRIDAGQPAEKALTTWARGARFAGSGDRAAVRDHVFDVLRRWRSTAVLGGAETGRGRIIGLLRQQGRDPDALFTGEGHAPAPLTEAERRAGALPDGAAALDLPDWLADLFRDDLGAAAGSVALALGDRAPVFLRVNVARATLAEAIRALAAEGIAARLHPDVRTALQITENARKLQRSKAFLDGLVEPQDAASQAAVLRLPLAPGDRVLDYCAGGGGKALAIAALTGAPVVAHDAEPRRMADIPVRAARAGATIAVCPAGSLGGSFDLVLADAPCSGSGTWRRAPEAKWRLTPERLAGLVALQAEVLAGAAARVRPGGHLAYATCSVLEAENGDRVAAFLGGHPGWMRVDEMRRLPGPEGDGFYLAVLRARSE